VTEEDLLNNFVNNMDGDMLLLKNMNLNYKGCGIIWMILV
jgi:hypothetical protein